MPNYRITPEPILRSGDIIAGDAANRGRDLLLLGKLTESGPRRRLWLDVTGEQVVAILGKRGTGKSYSLGVLLEAFAAGEGTSDLAVLNTPRACLVFDIMDIFWSSQLTLSDVGSDELRRQYRAMSQGGYSSRPLSVDVWIPAGFENLEVDPRGLKSLTIEASDLNLDDWGALFGVDIYTEPRGMLIADALIHVGRDGYTKIDGTTQVAKSTYSFGDLLECLQAGADIQANYQDATIRSVRQRMTTYQSLALFSGPGTPMTALLQSFRVSVLMLARLPDALKRVVVAVILRRIGRDRRDASIAQKRLDLDASLEATEIERLRKFVESTIPRTWVMMDEAHVLAGVNESSVATEALVKFAKEGRNYGLSLAVATQQPSALESRLMSQVETLLVHQLTSPADAEVAKRAMRSPAPETITLDGIDADVGGLLRRLAQGEAMFSCGNAPNLLRSCVLSMRPRISAHGGYEA